MNNLHIQSYGLTIFERMRLADLARKEQRAKSTRRAAPTSHPFGKNQRFEMLLRRAIRER